MLFTGDIEEIAEQEIIRRYRNNLGILKASILKVAHHGSKTSSTKEFVDKVKPKYVLIGVGKDNKFGHPNKSVLDYFKTKGYKIYRTDEYGEIHIRINENKESIETQIK